MCGQLDILLEKFKGNDYLGNICNCFIYIIYIKLTSLLLVGHFIVLIGYDPTEDLFIYRDPAANDEFCTISADDLDEARQSEGTDHDW